MTFDILQHLDQLEPDGGTNNPRGDHSFKCPHCGAPNFKVHVVTGMWAAYGCECSSTEAGKRAIREALSPARPPGQHRPLNLQAKSSAPQGFAAKKSPKPAAKPASKKAIRPKAKRSWEYRNKDGEVILRVNRTDDGKGNRDFWQTSLIRGARPKDLRGLVVPYRLDEALAALDAGAPFIAWVEGEGCVDRLWALGIPAVTSIGGSGGFDPERDGGHIPPSRLVTFSDQDQVGVKYACQVAASHPGCRFVLPFPGTPEWNGAMPEDGGLDVADWIADGATVEDILQGVQEANPFEVVEPVATPLEEWEELLEKLVDPDHIGYERNVVRRQIRAATAAVQLKLRVSPDQVRQRLQQKQRDRIADTSVKGVAGGEVVTCAERRWLIQGVIPMGCLVAVAAKIKVGKTLWQTELAASLILQVPFMGNPEWTPAPGHHRLILWWTDQPRVDSAQYLKARGLMGLDGRLHPQIVRLYSEEDSLDWGDQGIDELLRITTANPGAVLLTDSFYSNVRGIFGDDMDPGSGGALIDVQSTIGQAVTGHLCTFHSPQNGGVGSAAMRGHGSAKGVPSATISLHFLEKRGPNGKWIEDKDNPHRRMVMEGRMGYFDLLVRLHGAEARWELVGPFEKSLANLQADATKAKTVESLTEGQRQTLEWVAGAMGMSGNPSQGVTVSQVANAQFQDDNRPATAAERSVISKQLERLYSEGLLSRSKLRGVWHYLHRG